MAPEKWGGSRFKDCIKFYAVRVKKYENVDCRAKKLWKCIVKECILQSSKWWYLLLIVCLHRVKCIGV